MTDLIKSISIIALFLALLFMAETGFFIPWYSNYPLSHFSLLFHVGISGVFTAALIAVVFFVGINPFSQNVNTDASVEPAVHSWITKTCLAVTACLAVPLIFSMVLSMFPLFSTEGMKLLLKIHIYSAAGLFFTAMLFFYSFILDKRNSRT